MTISAEQAREMVDAAVRRIVPGADLERLPPDADLRQRFELDSLDFLGFVELLTEQSGVRIDEADYPELRTMSTCVDFLAHRSP